MATYKDKLTGAQVDSTAVDPAKTYVGADGAEVQGADILKLPSTPAPSDGLPEAEKSPILSYAGALDAAVNLARKSRNASALDIMKPYQGTAAASDFNSILSGLNTASDDTTKNLLKEAIPDSSDLLSVDEASKLGVPYGTTKQAAAKLGITPKKDDAFALSQTQRSQLLSGGFSAGDITHMENDIAAHGLDVALAGVPEASKELVRRVLAGSQNVADTVKGSIFTRDYVSKIFDIPDDDTSTGSTGGFFGLGSTPNPTGKDQLNDLMDRIQQWQAAGYSDAEIQKELEKKDNG